MGLPRQTLEQSCILQHDKCEKNYCLFSMQQFFKQHDFYRLLFESHYIYEKLFLNKSHLCKIETFLAFFSGGEAFESLLAICGSWKERVYYGNEVCNPPKSDSNFILLHGGSSKKPEIPPSIYIKKVQLFFPLATQKISSPRMGSNFQQHPSLLMTSLRNFWSPVMRAEKVKLFQYSGFRIPWRPFSSTSGISWYIPASFNTEGAHQ